MYGYSVVCFYLGVMMGRLGAPFAVFGTMTRTGIDDRASIERILAGGEITPDEALELAQKAIRSDLYAAADEIRKKFCNKTLDTCSIINARSGHCPENCKWCAQSAHHHTQIVP